MFTKQSCARPVCSPTAVCLYSELGKMDVICLKTITSPGKSTLKDIALASFGSFFACSSYLDSSELLLWTKGENKVSYILHTRGNSTSCSLTHYSDLYFIWFASLISRGIPCQLFPGGTTKAVLECLKLPLFELQN